MEYNFLPIINKWVEITNYDPDQHKFNLLSANYTFHRCSERMKELLKYDPTGMFAATYARCAFESIAKDLQCSLLDLLTNPDGIKEYQELWSTLNCPEMLSVEEWFIQEVVRVTQERTAIGEVNMEEERKTFRDSIEYIAEDFIKCHIEAFNYQPNTVINKDLVFDKTLQVFNTTTEAVLQIEQQADGLHLCYISEFNSTGGYFSYFIKSGKNIISINDRVPENFVGMHTRSRNNRFLEDKKWNIFPYKEIVDPQGSDYLGYAKSLVCTTEPKNIAEMSTHTRYTLLLVAHLLAKRFAGQKVESVMEDFGIQQVYIHSLLPNNVMSEETQAVIPVTNSSIVEVNKHIPLYNFTNNAIITNELQSKYHWRNEENKGKKHTGTFTDANKCLVDTYGKDFNINVDTVLKRNWPMLTDGQIGSSDSVEAEYIGTKDKIELEYYRQIRGQLAQHIIDKMADAYEEAGGIVGVTKWYADALWENKPAIQDMAVEFYSKYLEGEERAYELDAWSITTSDNMSVAIRNGHEGHWAPRVKDEFVLNAPDKTSRKYGNCRYDRYLCPITGGPANVWFIFVPNTQKNIEALAGKDTPKILTGFKYSGSDGFAVGNNLISSCDPVGFIHNPFESSVPHDYYDKFPGRQSMSFNMAIGFSKRGLNKLLKEYNQSK